MLVERVGDAMKQLGRVRVFRRRSILNGWFPVMDVVSTVLKSPGKRTVYTKMSDIAARDEETTMPSKAQHRQARLLTYPGRPRLRNQIDHQWS